MVVEDEAVIALRLQKMLKDMGHDVTCVAYSSEEALEKARSIRPDLILIDIMIPGEVDGIDVAHMVKSELDIPVIFLTAFSEDNIIQRAKIAEPYGYILKPFQGRELKAAIEVAFYKKEIEKALRESEARYRALVENSVVGIWQTTLDGRVIYMNPAMRRMLEIEDTEDLNEMSYHSFWDAENLEIVKRELGKREKGISSTYEVEVTGRKGSRRNVMISGAPIFYSEDKIHCAIATFTDITEKKKAELALMEVRDNLDHLVRERTVQLENALEKLEHDEKVLSQRKQALELLNDELLETNHALSVLARNIDKEKNALQKRISQEIMTKIMPVIIGLQKDVYCRKRQADLEVVAHHLNGIVSDSMANYNLDTVLTDQEMRVAVMIKNGVSSQKIADLLNISLHTVNTHRRNIRKKLKIQKSDISLPTYLKSRIRSNVNSTQTSE